MSEKRSSFSSRRDSLKARHGSGTNMSDTNATAGGGKPAPRRRRKVPRKGFGLTDWVRLTQSAKDLAQRKGAPLRRISAEEIKQHNTTTDGWCILHGKVYNLSPYLLYHPGGDTILKAVLGKDASTLFDKYHPWVSVEGLIGKLQLGYLDTGVGNAPPIAEEESDEDDDDE